MAKKKNKKQKKAIPVGKKSSMHTPYSWMTNSRLHYLLIGLLAFGLYANTLGHDFCQDDAIVITDNMFTKKGLAGIDGIWNKDTFYGFFKKEGKDQLVAGGRYRPLTLILFALEWDLFSDQKSGNSTASPFGFHLVNVLLFMLLGLLLYKVIVTLLHYYEEQESKFIAFFSTLVFVAHPVHTEVVANIKGADEIIALLGSLATLYFVLSAYRAGKIWRLVVGLIIFGLTIFSKENAITFLAIIPMALVLFGERCVGLTKEKYLRFSGYTFALVLSIFPFLVKRSRVLFGKPFDLMGPERMDLELMNNPFLKLVNDAPVPFSFGERIATIFYTLGEYLRLLIAPFKLTHDYYPNHIEMMHFGDWQVIVSVILYLGLIFLAVKNLRKKPLISFGTLVYLASLSIVSNFVFPVGTFMAERFVFMPSVGFALVVGTLLFQLFRQGKQTVALGIMGVLILLFSIKTIGRNPAWKNDSTLFLTDVKTSKKSAKIQNAVGGTLLNFAAKETDETLRKQKAKEALIHLKIALKEHPRYATAWLIQGNAYNYLEQFDQSIHAYKKALLLKPNYPEATKNLGITYHLAGKFFGEKQGDAKKAISYLEEGLKLIPENPETNRLLGIAHAINGHPELGIPYLEKAFSLAPNANLALDLSLAFAQIKNTNKAAYYQKKALAIDPEALRKRTQQ